MLIESETFERKIGGRSPKADVGDTVFRYCTFAGIEESAMVSSVFIGCTFEDSTWCMELFNCAVLVDCRFTRCACLVRDCATSRHEAGVGVGVGVKRSAAEALVRPPPSRRLHGACIPSSPDRAIVESPDRRFRQCRSMPPMHNDVPIRS